MSKIVLSIEVDEQIAAYLRSLTRSDAVPQGTLEDVLAHLVHSAADGVRRPGAWERDWLMQAFGEFPEGPQTPGVAYAHREPWVPDRIDEIDELDVCVDCDGTLVHVAEAGIEHGTWYCAHCDAGYLAGVDPKGLAVAALLAFALRCLTPRDERGEPQLELKLPEEKP